MWDMMSIRKALIQFYINNNGTYWPEQIEDIANLLENERNGLIDPWEKEYSFAIIEEKQNDGTISETPFIWSERIVDGKRKVVWFSSDMNWLSSDMKPKLTEYLKNDARKEQQGRKDVKALEQACRKYYLDNGKWPTKLADIAILLESGEKGLIDPWGSNYRFSLRKGVATDETQIDGPYIWSERTLNGMPRTCGNKPPREKK